MKEALYILKQCDKKRIQKKIFNKLKSLSSVFYCDKIVSVREEHSSLVWYILIGDKVNKFLLIECCIVSRVGRATRRRKYESLQASPDTRHIP